MIYLRGFPMKTKVNDLLKMLQDDGFGNAVDTGSMTDAELDLLETRQEVGALRQELADLRALVGALERDAENVRLRQKQIRTELNHMHARSAVKASGRTRLSVAR